MPTGYTNNIKDGISFKQFALQCSRAFGALIDMRDDPFGTEIPDEIKISQYHIINRLKVYNEQLTKIQNMSEKDCQIEAINQYNTETRHLNGCIDESKKLRKNYEEMLEKVNNWTPPTSEHKDLKRFMVEQIQESIKFDCPISWYEDVIKKLKLLRGYDWQREQIESIKNSINYHSKEHEKEVERCEKRNEWIGQLKKSLE
jgi:hypothetical protein